MAKQPLAKQIEAIERRLTKLESWRESVTASKFDDEVYGFDDDDDDDDFWGDDEGADDDWDDQNDEPRKDRDRLGFRIYDSQGNWIHPCDRK